MWRKWCCTSFVRADAWKFFLWFSKLYYHLCGTRLTTGKEHERMDGTTINALEFLKSSLPEDRR